MHRFIRNKASRTHLIFGANTDVGKTVISAGLVRASLRGAAFTGPSSSEISSVHYVKPLQCGGSDEIFVEKHLRALLKDTTIADKLQCQTLIDWETFASPHVASRKENYPKSDEEVLTALHSALSDIASTTYNNDNNTTTWIETAGGVLSPSSASPDNQSPYHAHATGGNNMHWGWLTQGDLYKPLANVAPVVLIGDGRLGGISATLSSLESLMIRGYNVAGLVLLETGYENVSAIREYASREIKLQSSSGKILFEDPETSIVSLPMLPPEPEPLYEWYESKEVVEALDDFNLFLQDGWEKAGEA